MGKKHKYQIDVESCSSLMKEFFAEENSEKNEDLE